MSRSRSTKGATEPVCTNLSRALPDLSMINRAAAGAAEDDVARSERVTKGNSVWASIFRGGRVLGFWGISICYFCLKQIIFFETWKLEKEVTGENEQPQSPSLERFSCRVCAFTFCFGWIVGIPFKYSELLIFSSKHLNILFPPFKQKYFPISPYLRWIWNYCFNWSFDIIFNLKYIFCLS
jgi:hypothetical protein